MDTIFMKRFFIVFAILIAVCSFEQKVFAMQNRFAEIARVKGLQIREYNPGRDKAAVLAIARQNIEALTNLRWYDWNEERALIDNVVPALDDHGQAGRKTLVCFKDEALIGFVNYTIYSPFYKKCIEKYSDFDIPQKAHINHIAVDVDYQGASAGSALMEEVIGDCEKQGVRVISLSTVGRDEALPQKTKDFYHKLGFYIFQTPATGSPADTGWKKRLVPHSAEQCLINIHRWWTGTADQN
jgi:ribosomal protein S18 acetylase RimI-like enzyme